MTVDSVVLIVLELTGKTVSIRRHAEQTRFFFFDMGRYRMKRICPALRKISPPFEPNYLHTNHKVNKLTSLQFAPIMSVTIVMKK